MNKNSQEATDLNLVKLRQLNKIIPKLLEASYLNQAKETKRVVLETLKPSSEFMSFVNDLPPNYLEKIIEVYKDNALKAYTAGQVLFADKEPAIKAAIKGMVVREQIAAYVRSKYRIDAVLCDELCSDFKLNTSKYLETLLNKDKLYMAVQKDMNNFFSNAIVDASVVSQDIKAAAEEEVAKQEIMPRKNKLTIEEYTKLLGPEHEDVLRVTLGLPPRKVKTEIIAETMTDRKAYASVSPDKLDALIRNLFVSADAEEEAPVVDQVYDPAQIKELTVELVKSHKFEEADDDLGYVVVDCLIPDAASLNDANFIAALKAKCPSMANDSSDPAEIDDYLDMVSAKLTADAGLPGQFLFTEVDDDFCLVFSFTKNSLLEMINKGVVTASAKKPKVFPKQKNEKIIGDLPATEDNLIPHAHQQEIKNLVSLGGQLKHMSLRSLRKASPTLASLISTIFAMLRSGKITMGEVAKRFFNASNEALIEETFGPGGKNYYLYLKQKA